MGGGRLDLLPGDPKHDIATFLCQYRTSQLVCIVLWPGRGWLPANPDLHMIGAPIIKFGLGRDPVDGENKEEGEKFKHLIWKV